MSPARKDPCRYPIQVNVYDLMPPSKLSAFLWTTGLSINHSGVVINEVEWAFGGHDVEGITGVYPSRPKEVPENAVYKCTIDVGICLLSLKEIEAKLERIKKEFTGPSYNLLTNNCNHFVQRVCADLCSSSPPAWINRIAGIGAMMPLCVSEAWVAPPVADPDAEWNEHDDDHTRLLPPSEVAPMQAKPSRPQARDEPHGRVSFSRTVSEYTDLDNDEALADRDLTSASGGFRIDVGSR
ncbi:PPPDE putative peptidase domain-domain-containing protein [Protomyces lactucae-debilis]|uniref:PPPDE putative peptidase domain-domain-containing protein n=1 Tax=Protomyces lactucae-debilis TaxID=2754530 RepID=A0A1Y2FHH0_PROLT|nr:PPPDE putative peptidase domain-containing protein [Protomyces lactucae-debilis]ORY83047.1 PPPDE putative peptidase domain-domain-containing protein [Protomyces lactucae-debilis]